MLSRTAVLVSVGLSVVLIIGVIVVGRLVGSSVAPAAPSQSVASPPATGPVALVPVEAPDAGSAACAALIGALPTSLTSGSQVLHRLPLAAPAPPATMAWGGSADPVILRCGLSRPPELTQTAELREISGVSWLPVSGPGATTWYLAGRSVYVALTVPADTGTGVLQGVSETVARVV